MLIFSEQEVQRVASETMDLYAPLANRLGIGYLKWQLEDLAFRYLVPQEYQAISKGLKERRGDREQYVQSFIQHIKEQLSSSGIDKFQVTGRAKHIYSLFKKMQRKNVMLDEIYDALAFRILVPTIDDCYIVLSIIHSLWVPIPKEFDDYISAPKSNGYRSIHTAVYGPDNTQVEIQIRTFDMHQEAELGIAAHWVYKEGRAKQNAYEQKIAWLRQVMAWQKEMTEVEAEGQEILTHIFTDRIYVFTPTGDVIDLQAGATPLDFAYHIHSELGHHCKGAKVNGTIVPLTYSLNTGDKIEILSAKQGHPSRDWLNPHLGYLKTSRAKAKVMNWFRKLDYDRHVLEGHELLEKELKKHAAREISFDALADKLNYKSKEDMFAALGRGDLRLHSVLLMANLLVTPQTTDKTAPLPEVAKIKPVQIAGDIVIEGMGQLLTYLAKCCKPVPGDDIAGYITIGRGVSIHRQDCPNLLERTHLYPNRRIDVTWSFNTLRHYPVDLSILANQQPHLINELTALLANEKIAILALNAVQNKRDNTILLTVTVEVDGLNPLSRLLARISQLPNILSVQRE